MDTLDNSREDEIVKEPEAISGLAKSLHNFNDKITSKAPVPPVALHISPQSTGAVPDQLSIASLTLKDADTSPALRTPLTVRRIDASPALRAPSFTPSSVEAIEPSPVLSAPSTKPLKVKTIDASQILRLPASLKPQSRVESKPEVISSSLPPVIKVSPTSQDSSSEDVSSPILEDALRGFKSTVVEDDSIELNIADFTGVSQYDLPKSIIFGTLLIDMVTEGHDMTAHDLELLYEIFGNPELMASCIKNFKQAEIYEVIDVVKDTFSHDQKMKLMINLADLVYRNGVPDEVELKDINNLALEINVILGELKKVLDLLKLKHDPDIFED
jgi:hypothetical protein